MSQQARIEGGLLTARAGLDPTLELPSIGRLREALADLREQFSAAGRVAPVLASDEAGFCLTFGEDVGHEVVE